MKPTAFHLLYLLAGLGGALGAMGRYWLGPLIQSRFAAGFPYGTLFVNLLGSLLLGYLFFRFEGRSLAAVEARAFLFAGVLGGFTTFSTFSLETLTLLREGQALAGFTYAAVSFLGGLGATWLGSLLARL